MPSEKLFDRRTIYEGGFWRRNADKVLLLIIGAIIGSIVTALVNIVTKHS